MLCGAVIWYQYIFHKLSNNICNKCCSFFLHLKDVIWGRRMYIFHKLSNKCFFQFFFAPKSCYVGHRAGGRTIWGIVSKESFVKRKPFSSFFSKSYWCLRHRSILYFQTQSNSYLYNEGSGGSWYHIIFYVRVSCQNVQIINLILNQEITKYI